MKQLSVSYICLLYKPNYLYVDCEPVAKARILCNLIVLLNGYNP